MNGERVDQQDSIVRTLLSTIPVIRTTITYGGGSNTAADTARYGRDRS